MIQNYPYRKKSFQLHHDSLIQNRILMREKGFLLITAILTVRQILEYLTTKGGIHKDASWVNEF